jgi:regulator of protease activity HflC (stomatin/prohibitin superfamily)
LSMRNALIVVLALTAAACSTAEPDAGFEAVLVRKPMFIGSGGVDATPVKTGLRYIAGTTSAIVVDMRPRQQEVTFDDLFTADGVPLDFHSAIQYRITDSVKLVRDFGADDGANGMGFFHRNLEQGYRMIVRDAVKKHGLNEMAINVTAAQSVDDEVTARFNELIVKSGVPISLLGVTLGRASPPDAIKHQRIATAEQEQRQKTEQQAKIAEDQRRAHEESRALADNAYRESMKLSVPQYIELMRINMLQQACAKATCTFINGGGVVPTIDVK